MKPSGLAKDRLNTYQTSSDMYTYEIVTNNPCNTTVLNPFHLKVADY